MPASKLQAFLDEHDVRYDTIHHPQSFTAQEIAASAHIPGRELAKTVMVKLDGRLAMAVVPAPDQVSLMRLKEMTGAHTVALAAEEDFRDLFVSCETGAMPPFGNLWDVPVFVDRKLEEDESIAFNGGSHTELVRLAWADYRRLVEPEVGELSGKARRRGH